MNTAYLSIILVGLASFAMRATLVFRPQSKPPSARSRRLATLVAPAAFATIATTNVLGIVSADARSAFPLLAALVVAGLVVRRTGSTTRPRPWSRLVSRSPHWIAGSSVVDSSIYSSAIASHSRRCLTLE